VVLRAPAHREQPATGADIERDAMVRAIAPDCLDEDPLAARRHVFQSCVLFVPVAKSRKNAGNGAKPDESQSYS
jgi:hypothetical protein